MRIILLAPAPFATVSGGYAYDRRIAAGLRDAGHAVEVIELANDFDPRATLAALPADAVAVIDGLALPGFAVVADQLAHGIVGLVHHPTALDVADDAAPRRALEREIFARLGRIIVTSEATRAQLSADFAVDAGRLRVVVPATDDAPRSTGSAGGGCMILSVGTLTPRKGHDVLLRALSRLFDLDWRLVIVGSARRDPAHATRLVQLAEGHGIAGRVQFAGEVDDAELDRLWRQADVFALATRWEGYGMAVAEALKRGVPVAVTSGGAASALVTPALGVVCPPDDHDQLSKALRRMIFDRALRRDMAEAAWQAGQALPSWTAQAEAFAEALT
jgi:glycosyltransferase involved in cell wall biosynthesis